MIFLIFLPFIMAVLMRNFCKSQKKLASDTVLFTMLIEFMASVIVILNFNLDKNISHICLSGIGGLGLSLEYDAFRGLFGVLTAFAWFACYWYLRDYLNKDKKLVRYFFYNLVTLGATEGIFFAADFFTLFFFFEIMSLASFMWVAHKETKDAKYAAGTYLGISIAGGLAILMGVFIIYDMYGTVNFLELQKLTESGNDIDRLYIAAGCLFAGFGAKASAFPVHVWLPNAYTQAPAPESALLSAILSKTGIFGILMITYNILPGNDKWGLYIVITGIITMLVGGIRGVLSINFKTTIAYSSMSQIGFILVGVGMQALSRNTCDEAYYIAMSGTFLHMLNHSIVKLILFLISGVIFINVGSYEINKVRGFGRNKPFLMVTFTLAAAGISGIPLLNGYVSKTLLHESIVEYIGVASDIQLFKTIEILFLFSGGLTLCYMLKLFIVLFVEKNNDDELQEKYENIKEYIGTNSKYAIATCAISIPFLGILPNIVSDYLVEYVYSIENEVNYFNIENLKGAAISICVGIAIYLLIIRLIMYRRKGAEYKDIWPKWIDLEKYVYRALFYKAFAFILGIISRILDSIVDTVIILLRKSVFKDLGIPYELPEGNKATHIIGASMENVRRVRYAFSKKEYEKKDYEHKLALKRTDIIENTRIIERSLSFGLFMFCIGLTLTLVYLLLVN